MGLNIIGSRTETLTQCYWFPADVSTDEPDSAFEATQYFFEDITPETSMGKWLTASVQDNQVYIYFTLDSQWPYC